MTAETNSQGEQVDELSKIKSSSRRSPSTMSPSRKLLQREATSSLLKDDERGGHSSASCTLQWVVRGLQVFDGILGASWDPSI